MTEGLVTGREGRFLTTKQGISAVKAEGLTPQVLDLSQSLLYRNW